MTIKVGDTFVRENGKKLIKILGEEDGVFTCQLDVTNQMFRATKDTVKSWVKVKAEDLIPQSRRNKVSLKNVCIDVLKTTLQPMTATEIYKYICEHKLFEFSDKAKTPVNTVHARISEYIKKDNAKTITHNNGKFIYHLDAIIPF